MWLAWSRRLLYSSSSQSRCSVLSGSFSCTGIDTLDRSLPMLLRRMFHRLTSAPGPLAAGRQRRRGGPAALAGTHPPGPHPSQVTLPLDTGIPDTQAHGPVHQSTQDASRAWGELLGCRYARSPGLGLHPLWAGGLGSDCWQAPRDSGREQGFEPPRGQFLCQTLCPQNHAQVTLTHTHTHIHTHTHTQTGHLGSHFGAGWGGGIT